VFFMFFKIAYFNFNRFKKSRKILMIRMHPLASISSFLK
jgi:hypothetical protein